MIKVRWFIYTVIVGLLPFLIRLFVWMGSINNKDWGYIFNEIDVVAFGLVLHISVINELEHEKELDQKCM